MTVEKQASSDRVSQVTDNSGTTSTMDVVADEPEFNDSYKEATKTGESSNEQTNEMIKGFAVETTVNSDRFEQEFGQEGGSALREMGFDSVSFSNNQDGSTNIELNRSHSWTSPSGNPTIGREASFNVTKQKGADSFLAKDIKGLEVRTMDLSSGMKISKAENGATKLTLLTPRGIDGGSLNLPQGKNAFEAIKSVMQRANRRETETRMRRP